MSYQKHNFYEGQTLSSIDANEIDEGIIANETAIQEIGQTTSGFDGRITEIEDSISDKSIFDGLGIYVEGETLHIRIGQPPAEE